MGTEENFLSRWSRRKREAGAGAGPGEAESGMPGAARAAAPAVAPGAPAATEAAAPIPAADPVPPLESLTPASDFTRFMAPDVDGDVRRNALKTLFSDPHFNVMDMMDVYVDDYSKPDPLPQAWLEKLEQVSRLGDRAGRDREAGERRRAEQAAAEAAALPPESAGADAAAEPAPPPVNEMPAPEGATQDGEADIPP
jgi:hypothetical protein